MLIAREKSFDNAIQSRKNTFNVITFNETKLKKSKHYTQKIVMFYYNK